MTFTSGLVVLLLVQNTDHLQQVEDYVRGCTTSTNTDLLQQVEDYVNWKRIKQFKGLDIF